MVDCTLLVTSRVGRAKDGAGLGHARVFWGGSRRRRGWAEGLESCPGVKECVTVASTDPLAGIPSARRRPASPPCFLSLGQSRCPAAPPCHPAAFPSPPCSSKG
eukprot:752524-Hanusia_phi.AAC.3